MDKYNNLETLSAGLELITKVQSSCTNVYSFLFKKSNGKGKSILTSLSHQSFQ